MKYRTLKQRVPRKGLVYQKATRKFDFMDIQRLYLESEQVKRVRENNAKWFALSMMI